MNFEKKCQLGDNSVRVSHICCIECVKMTFNFNSSNSEAIKHVTVISLIAELLQVIGQRCTHRGDRVRVQELGAAIVTG